MSEIRIVPATERDLAVILELIVGLAEYEKRAHIVKATEEKLRESLFGSNPAAEVVLARWGEECAGFAVFFGTYSTFLAQRGIYLEDLYVKADFRGRGIGLVLMRAVARIARERGCGRMDWGVLNWNEPAIEFYRRLGAAPADEWTKYVLQGEALERLAAKE